MRTRTESPGPHGTKARGWSPRDRPHSVAGPSGALPTERRRSHWPRASLAWYTYVKIVPVGRVDGRGAKRPQGLAPFREDAVRGSYGSTVRSHRCGPVRADRRGADAG